MDCNVDTTLSQTGLKTSIPSQYQGRDYRTRALNKQGEAPFSEDQVKESRVYREQSGEEWLERTFE